VGMFLPDLVFMSAHVELLADGAVKILRYTTPQEIPSAQSK